jgi:rhamnogalacturonyl hydrolase YesR
MTSVVEYQDAASGVWFDVLDVDDPRNYLEATASSMFAYCLLKGHRMGYLDDSFLEAGIRAYKGIIKEFVKQNANGTISLTKCCEVSGLGPENKPHRDGSFEYYMSENVRDNDPKGIGPFIWASLEMERLGFTVQNLDTHTAVSAPKFSRPANGIRYDLLGRKICRSTRGVIIQDGRKSHTFVW